MHRQCKGRLPEKEICNYQIVKYLGFFDKKLSAPLTIFVFLSLHTANLQVLNKLTNLYNMATSFTIFEKPKNHTVFILMIWLVFSNFLYAQVLTGVDPDEGMQAETLDLVISGQSTHFLQATSVSVNLQQGTSTIIMPQQLGMISDEAIQATFSFSYNNAPGIYDLRVMNEIDGALYLYDAFEITENPLQPELVSIDPDSAAQGEVLDMIISGQNTHFQASTTTVMLKQGTLTILPQYNQVISDTGISAHFVFGIYHPLGQWDVQTHNNFDGLLTLPDAFTLLPVAPPALLGIQPAQALNGTMYTFDVYGENTHFLQASGHAAWLMLDGSEVLNLEFVVLNNLHLQGTIILPHVSTPGSYDLHVLNNIDGEIILEDAFVLNENPEDPEVLYLEPDSAYAGQAVEVNAFTQNTWFDWAVTLNTWLKKSGSFQNIYNLGTQIIGDEQLEINFAIPMDAIPGFYDLYIINNLDGQIIGDEVFYVIDTITGLQEPGFTTPVTVYPNPVTENLFISTGKTIRVKELSISSFTGRHFVIQDFTFYEGAPMRIDMSGVPGGLYFINMITEDKMINKKIIKY